MRFFIAFWLFVFLAPFAFGEQRNLVLITIDTLRPDYVSFNGSTSVKTPNLDELASGGVNFKRVRTSVPLTLPAHTSILTGLYPPEHGVRDNASFVLSQDKQTLAEILQKEKYETAAFVGSFVLDHRFGLAQGFEIYNDRMTGELESPEAERNADAVYTAFSNWFKQRNARSPFFVWLHFYDPHAPYVPPPLFAKRYPKNPYAGEVAYADSVAGKVLKDLKASGLSTKTLIAVVGDHGEGLGEHGEMTHSVLTYNSTLSVPMILSGPSVLPSGLQVAELVRTIDLAPTLLDYLGLAQKFGEGRSLRPLIERKPAPIQLAYSESLYPKLNLGWSELRGIEDERYHFILAPHPELFDITKDPAEKQNLIGQIPAVAAQLKMKLQETPGGKEEPAKPVDAETAEKLRSLGYISGSKSASQNRTIDPKEKMEAWNRIQVGILQFSAGKYEQAQQSFRQILVTEKDNPFVYDYLCSCAMRMQQWENAERCYRDAAQRSVGLPSASLNLGIIHYNKRELTDAKAQLQDAIKEDSGNVTAHYYLGNTLRALGELQNAADEYQQALKINPSYVFALNGLGMTYAALKMDEDAAKAFQQAVVSDPQNPGAYYNLGVQLKRMNRNKEALEALQKFMKLASGPEFAQQRQKASAIMQQLKQ